MYNGEVGISFYFLEAPSKKGVEKHHGNMALNVTNPTGLRGVFDIVLLIIKL
jgi:hypothetical protein